MAGRRDVRPEELFRLIHRVNPTGRDLSRGEQERLYEQKSRLQSLLVRRFGELVVVKRTADDDVVSLAHRSDLEDACHAVVSRLEADARAWVRRELDVTAGPEAPEDLGGLPAPRPRPPDGAEPASVEELVARGKNAIRDYEYEAAEKDLTLAVERGGGGPEAAVPLLELWVGVLGMDEEALALEPRLAARTKELPKIRTLLALAAARRGDERRALRLVKGVEASGVADVYAALAAGALRGHNPQAGERYTGETAALDPAHPELGNLRRGLDELRAAARRPAEEELAGRCEREGPLAVEDEARAFSEKWGESEVARRILRQTAELHRRREIEEELVLGGSALAEERFDDAARHLQKALDAGCERAGLPQLIEKAAATAAERAAAERSAAVAERFAEDPRGALLAYLALPADLRDRVRQDVDRPVLGWLEEAGAPSSGSKAQAAVTAVLALERAVAALAGGDAAAACDVLSPHAPALGAVAAAERCLGEATSQLAAARRRRARESFAAVREAFDGGRIDRAWELYEAVALADLDAGERSRAGEIDLRLRQAERRRDLESELDRHLAADDFAGAVDRVRTLAEEASSEEERRRWQARLQELRQRLRSACRLELESGFRPLGELRDFELPSLYETIEVWLDDDGKEMLFANARDRWLFVRVVDVERAAIVEWVSLSTPEPWGDRVSVCVDGERIWLAGSRGGVLEMARDGWEVLGWHSLREDMPQDVVVEDVTLVPASPFLWVQFRRLSGHETKSHVVDRRSWRRTRRFSEGIVMPILGPEPCVVCSHFGSEPTTKVYSPRGTPLRAFKLPPERLVCVAPFPVGGSRGEASEALGLLVATEGIEADDEIELRIVPPTPPANPYKLPQRRLAGVDPESRAVLATDLEQGIGFLFVNTYDDDETLLLALAASGEGFEELYRVRFPAEPVLVQNRGSGRAVAVFRGLQGLRTLALGPEPPPEECLADIRVGGEWGIPNLGGPFLCGRHVPPEANPTHQIPALDGPDRERALDRFEEDFAADVDLLVNMYRGLRKLNYDEPAWVSRVRRLAERHPEHARTALLLANSEAEAESWKEVHSLLSAVDSRPLVEADEIRHFYHLLGLALVRLGRVDEANAIFEKGLAYPGGFCSLPSLAELTLPMGDPPEEHEWATDQPMARQLLGAIRTADVALERGDPAAARRVVECPAAWRAREVQSAARLAEIYLRLDPQRPLRFSKRLALAGFCEAHQAEGILRKELKLPGLAWDRKRLDELEERARSWLEGD